MAAYQVLDSLSHCHDLSFAQTTPSESQHQEPICPLKQNLQRNKEKSELCNKFMMFGLCPYGQLCKFAHGSHQLRQNNKQNNRYKTKKCESFFNESYCHYGDRCNFKHSSEKEKKDVDIKWRLIYKYNRECIIESKPQSRLLELIKE